MRLRSLAVAVGLTVASGTTLAAQQPGSFVPEEIELDDFTGLPVDDFSELAGRTVLLEFFAYW